MYSFFLGMRFMTVVSTRSKLLDRMCKKRRLTNNAWKTENSHVAWVKKFLRFHKYRNGVTDCSDEKGQVQYR